MLRLRFRCARANFEHGHHGNVARWTRRAPSAQDCRPPVEAVASGGPAALGARGRVMKVDCRLPAWQRTRRFTCISNGSRLFHAGVIFRFLVCLLVSGESWSALLVAWIGVEEMYLSSERLSEENIWLLTSSVLLARLVFTRLVCPRLTVAGASGESHCSADKNRFYREADPVNVGRDGVCSLRVRTSGIVYVRGKKHAQCYVSARAVEVRVSASGVRVCQYA